MPLFQKMFNAATVTPSGITKTQTNKKLVRNKLTLNYKYVVGAITILSHTVLYSK